MRPAMLFWKSIAKRHEINQLKMKLFKVLPVGTPFPPGWADHLMGDDYLPPEGDEWPPWSKKVR
jgi:hypothetical protein